MGTSRIVLTWSLRAALTWAVVAPATGMAQVQFYPVGHLPNSVPLSQILGLSGDGRVAVGMDMGAGRQSAIRWSSADGLTQLPGTDGSLSMAFGISDDARAIAGYVVTGDQAMATAWIDGAGVPLGDLPGGRAWSHASGVSGDGRVFVGGSEDHDGDRGFRWTAARGVQPLLNTGSLRPVYPRDASFEGSVIVGTAFDESARRPAAFRWTEAAGTEELPTLSPLFPLSEAFGASADGSVIVGYAWNDDDETRLTGDACIWPAGGDPFFLGAAPLAGGAFGIATAVSADGSTVVGYLDVGGAFIWDRAHGSRLLMDVLRDDYGLELDGWTLQSAHAISADGLTIGGYAINPAGDGEGYVVVLPGPSGALLGVLGLAGMTRRRR